METYIERRELMPNPVYEEDRRRTLAGLTDEILDAPVRGIVRAFNRLPHCYTLQSCYGHFLYDDLKDPRNLARVPRRAIAAKIEYRIAYVAFCVENSLRGKMCVEAFEEMTALDPDYVQFCSARWFWDRQVNSYALQVEPDRFKDRDTAVLDYVEAIHVEEIRDKFFERLGELIEEEYRRC